MLSAAPRMQEKELIEHVFSQAERFINAEQEEAKKTHNDFLDYVVTAQPAHFLKGEFGGEFVSRLGISAHL